MYPNFLLLMNEFKVNLIIFILTTPFCSKIDVCGVIFYFTMALIFLGNEQYGSEWFGVTWCYF